MSFRSIKDPTRFYGSSLKDTFRPSEMILWGKSLDISRDAAGGWMPLGDPGGQLDLINIPKMDWERPVLFTLDLLVIDLATGMPPVGLPPPPFDAGGFRVLFGGGNDVREFRFDPGIHSLLGDNLRVRVIPQQPTGVPIVWRFHAVCTVQEGVAPSYTFVGP
jgi:hypothetical protein